MASHHYTALFSDIGGVIGTNGWDTSIRLRVTKHFSCDLEQVEARHHLLFDSYERGFLTFDQYLQKLFFSEPRPFTLDEVREYAFAESVPWPENISLLASVKHANSLKLALISNEGEGLTEHRAEKFGLSKLADFAIFSYFVHMRKPDLGIWKMALKLALVEAAETIYIDDRELFTEIAADLGFTVIHHVSLEDTRDKLRCLGLTVA